MIDALILLLTLGLVLGGGVIGHRFGLRWLVAAVGPGLVAWGVGGVVTMAGISRGWFHPWGLLTPAVIGFAGATATWAGSIVVLSIAKGSLFLGADPTSRTSGWDRSLGTTTGGLGGIVLGVWIGIFVVLADDLSRPVALDHPRPGSESAPTPAPEPRSDPNSWTRSLLRTAHHGFTRHLPWIGPLGDEIEALIVILNSDRATQDRLARRHGFRRLAELPSFQAILDDDEIIADIEAIGRGRISALYRLQKNRRVLSFLEEEAVQSTIERLRPSTLAREIGR